MAESRVAIVSLAQAYNRDKERGFVPYRKITPEYRSLAEQATDFEARIGTPKRLSNLEERLEKAELQISILTQRLNNDPIKAYLEPLCSRIAQIEAQTGLERAKTKEPIDLPQIIVPHELRVLKGKGGKCKNRTFEIVQKRWNLWKAQHEAGIPMNAIARAWDCDHGSICYAKANNWIAKRSDPCKSKRLK